jgi:hypothetical protein
VVVVAAVVVTAAAFAAVAFAAAAFVAVGDSYNEPVYQGSAGYTDEEKVDPPVRFSKTGE